MDSKADQPSRSSSSHGDAESTAGDSAAGQVHWDRLRPGSSRNAEPSPAAGGSLRRSGSSISMRLHALGDAGGPNSLNNFARSWQRAAGFYEIRPARPSFVVEPDQERPDLPQTSFSVPRNQPSLLRAALQGDVPENAIHDTDDESGPNETAPLLDRHAEQAFHRPRDVSILSVEPSLASPFGGSYGTSYSSLTAHTTETSMRHAGRLFAEQQRGAGAPEQEREPLVVKQVEEDGRLINVVVGRSTLPQTIFNSVNVLVGVGLLTLPLGLRYSGWLIGMLFFVFAAVSTSYTAKLLAKCLDADSSLITFADLAYVSFGNRARIAVSALFTLELLASCVALVILFADSLDALIPSLGGQGWKIVCGLILIPLGFLPLRLLSFTSILGVVCCLATVAAVWIDGLIKPHQPGSLREPASQHLFPANWLTVPLSFGLLMSPWGGHSVFPNIYRDMRHPYKYRKGVNITYVFTFFIDLGMACAGILMFGDGVREEITSNIFHAQGYPAWLSVLIVVCIAIIPVTKVPLNARPIITTIEVLAGLDSRSLAASSGLDGMSGLSRGFLVCLIRIATIVVVVVIAIVFPSFDRIMALLGSVACFTICIILPLAFHLKLFGKEIAVREKLLNWLLIVVSAVMAMVSTVFAFFPSELLTA